MESAKLIAVCLIVAAALVDGCVPKKKPLDIMALLDERARIEDELYGPVQVTRSRKWIAAPVFLVGSIVIDAPPDGEPTTVESKSALKKVQDSVEQTLVAMIQEEVVNWHFPVVDRDSFAATAREVAVGMAAPTPTPANILISGKMILNHGNNTLRLQAIDLTTQEILATASGRATTDSAKTKGMVLERRIASRLIGAVRNCTPASLFPEVQNCIRP